MTNSFLKTGEHRLLIAGVDVDDAIGSKTDLGKSRREKVLPGAPQNLALRARRDASGEQGRCGSVDGRVATTGNLVQRAERQPTTWQPRVDSLDTEREYGPGTLLHAFKTLNLLAKPQDGGWLDRSTHALVRRFSGRDCS